MGILKRSEIKYHQTKAKAMKSQSKLPFANPQLAIINDKEIEAEVKMAVLTASAKMHIENSLDWKPSENTF